MMATRVKNGKKTAGVKERAVNFYVRGGMTKEAAQKRVNAEYRTVSARARNYRKITGSKETNEKIYSKFVKFGAKDDTVREILKIPTTNPKVTKAQAGGDIERYSKKTIQTAAYYSANAWLNSFTISIQTAGNGSNLRRIWFDFTMKAAPTIKGAERFWREFDRIPRGFVAADQAFPKDWDITEALVKELIEKLKKWSKDYENANKGGIGAGSDGLHINPVTGS